MNFWQELQRRRVYRLAALYIVAAWLLIQVADVFFPAWGIPPTALRFLIIALALCFPIALVFAWTFDVTSKGIVRTPAASQDATLEMSLRRLDYLVLIALFGVGLAILFGSIQRIAQEVSDAETIESSARIANSVAILPFTNLDSNPDTGYFADGVTEEILHRLSTLKTLHILGRTSSFAFRNSEQGPARISELLGVRYLLHGSVRRDENFVRVTARLLDETGYQVWSQTFDRELAGIFVIQSEIASTVASQIINKIIPLDEQPAARTTKNMDAYNEYLIGRAFTNSRVAGWQPKATESFRRAIELDAGYAPPYAGLAVSLTVGNSEWEDTREEALAAAHKAIELDAELAEGHAALGLLLFAGNQTDPPAAAISLRRALELDPTLSSAYNWLASALGLQGLESESDAVQDQGLVVDPLNPALSVNIANRHMRSGRTQEAEQLMLRLTYLPDPPGLAYWELVGLYTDTGQYDKAVVWAKEVLRRYFDTSNAMTYGSVAWGYERLGLSADADYWMRKATLREPDPVVRYVWASYLWKLRGDTETMRTELEKLGDEWDFDRLPPFASMIYAVSHIQIGEYAKAIELFEQIFGNEPIAIVETLEMMAAFEISHSVAFAYQQVGRVDDAKDFLEQLATYITNSTGDALYPFPPGYEVLALNKALSGDAEGALQELQRAVDAGWNNYFWLINDPAWASTLTKPGFAGLLDKVKIEVERQIEIVERADVEHDFRAEIEALEMADSK